MHPLILSAFPPATSIQDHQLYCGYVTERDPFLLAVAKTDVQSYGVSQYRAILWRKTVSTNEVQESSLQQRT